MISAPLIFFYYYDTTMLTYFPNRLELLFRTVFAFPNASRIGLQLRILSSIPIWDVYWITICLMSFALFRTLDCDLIFFNSGMLCWNI